MPRFAKFLSILAVVMLTMTMLLACGEEDDDIGNGGNAGNDGGSTPTNQPGSTPTTGGDTGTPTQGADDEGIAHPTGDDESIIVISYEGGFVMPTMLLTRLPLFVLLGNGCVITEGPQIEIFPAPALPNLQQTCLTEEGVQDILKAAEEAGLLDGDADYPVASIADAVSTVFTINANGTTTRVSAYALAEGEFSSPDLSPEEVEARKKLSDFLAQVTDLRSFLPEDAFVGEDEPYDIERLQTVFIPKDSSMAPMADEELQQQELEWPGSTPIAQLEPFFMEQEGLVCGVVEGDDLAPVLEMLGQANQLTLWSDTASTSGPAGTPDPSIEAEYYLLLRPLFPGNTGCSVDEAR
jgi:hypothetical protein